MFSDTRAAAVTEAGDQIALNKEISSDDDDTEYIRFLKTAANRGYRLIPELEGLIDQLEKSRMESLEKADEMYSLKQRLRILEDNVKEFGKRKQRYLRRIAKDRH